MQCKSLYVVVLFLRKMIGGLLYKKPQAGYIHYIRYVVKLLIFLGRKENCYNSPEMLQLQLTENKRRCI